MPKICRCEGCRNPIFGKGYCKWHQSKRPDYKKPAFKKSPVKKQSKKTARETAEYNKRVEEWKIEDPICRVAGCGKPTDDCHHKIGRGIHLLDERYWIPLCRKHHDLCKEKPKLAAELGLIETRTITRKYKNDSHHKN